MKMNNEKLMEKVRTIKHVMFSILTVELIIITAIVLAFVILGGGV